MLQSILNTLQQAKYTRFALANEMSADSQYRGHINMFSTTTTLIQRPRRLRQHPALRRLVQETQVHGDDLILPLFVCAGQKIKRAIPSLPGHYQWSCDELVAEIKVLRELGILGVMLFGLPVEKDALGSSASKDKGVVQQAVRLFKEHYPECLVISDLCFCEYTDHGHCGALTASGLDVDNDRTLNMLGVQAVSHARAGADVIAPSGMMDGMVAAIRTALDEAGFTHIPILSYAVKYSSALYGPFRLAAQTTLKQGDRKTYQMDPANRFEALKEVELDIAEGADMLMVKPAHTYLDIIRDVKENFPMYPLGAYHVSGEYAMIKAAAAQNLIDEMVVAKEVLTAIKRAGADFIITYYAKEIRTVL